MPPTSDANRRSQSRQRDPPRIDGVVVIIPARNEQTSLPLVLSDLPSVEAVVVVDNGSSDATAQVASRHGVIVVSEERQGYGSACLKGLWEVERLLFSGTISHPRVIVFLDADYSDHPDLLPQLVGPILSGHADFVLGSRLTGRREPGAMPSQSVFGNQLACLLMRVLWGTCYTDLGPFRAIQYDLLRKLGMADPDFGWTVEMQIKAALAGAQVLEIPVPYRRRIGTSKISGTLTGSIKAGAKIIYTIGKYAWQTARPARTEARRHRIH